MDFKSLKHVLKILVCFIYNRLQSSIKLKNKSYSISKQAHSSDPF